MTDTRIKQFAVFEHQTGLETRANGRQYMGGHGFAGGFHQAACRAGYHYPFDCDVTVVPTGEEIPLPFDEIPLILRRPGQAGRPA